MSRLIPLLALAACTQVHTQEESLDAAGFSTLRVVTESGDVVISGDPLATTITVRAESAEIAMEPPLFGWSVENRAVTVTGLWGKGVLTEGVSLHITAPARLAVQVHTAKGDLTVTDVASLCADAGPGDFTVARVAGYTDLMDGNGDLVVSEVGGDLWLQDGNGDATVSGVRGDLVLWDGSGDTTLEEVGGDAQIEDGTGDLTVRGLGGDAQIDDSSGDITLDDIAGAVQITDGTGDIRVGAVRSVTVIEDGTGEVIYAIP